MAFIELPLVTLSSLSREGSYIVNMAGSGPQDVYWVSAYALTTAINVQVLGSGTAKIQYATAPREDILDGTAIWKDLITSISTDPKATGVMFSITGIRAVITASGAGDLVINIRTSGQENVIEVAPPTEAQFDKVIYLPTPKPTYTEGTTYWDTENHTLAMMPEVDGPILQIGQENWVRVKNNTASTLTNGTVVYINSADNTAGVPTVEKAIATTYDTSRIIGIITNDIPAGEIGYVTNFGEVNDLNTSAYTAGNLVYLSDTIAGTFTHIRPTGANYIVTVGVVSKVSALAGRVYVQPTAQEYTVETIQETGWSPSAQATLAFTDATRTLTISPIGANFQFYQQGTKYIKTTDSIQLPDTEGTYIIYYNGDTLAYIYKPNDGQIDTLIRNNTTVAYIYWDATNKKLQYFSKELHRIGMDTITHAYLHFSFGLRYLSGLAPTNVVVDGSGNSNASAQFGIGAGGVNDEDIFFPITAIASTTGLRVGYLNGTTAVPTLRSGINTGYSVLTTGTGRLAYNFLTGGNWTVAEVTNNNFVLCHIIAINGNSPTDRLVAMMGQAQYTTIANARAAAQTEIKSLALSGIVPQESKAVATFVFETANSYTNAVKGRVRSFSSTENYIDWRTTYFNGSNAGGGSGGFNTSIFSDETFIVYDDLDPTKQVKLQVAGLTTGTTRLINIPDANSTTITEIAQTINGVKTFTDSPLVPYPDMDNEASNKQYVDEASLINALIFG